MFKLTILILAVLATINCLKLHTNDDIYSYILSGSSLGSSSFIVTFYNEQISLEGCKDCSKEFWTEGVELKVDAGKWECTKNHCEEDNDQAAINLLNIVTRFDRNG